MAVQGHSKQRDSERLAGNVLLLARMRRGWTQRQLADAAGVPVSTMSRIETGARQPSLVTLSRLLAAADLELRYHLEDYDHHDDVLDAGHAALTDEQRVAADAAFSRTSALLAASRERPPDAGPVPGRRRSSGRRRLGDRAERRPGASGPVRGADPGGGAAAPGELRGGRGFAAELHGSVRKTVDVDAVPETTRENLVRLSPGLTEPRARVRSESEPAGLAFDTSAESLAGVRMLNMVTPHGEVDLTFQLSGSEGYPDLQRAAVLVSVGAVASSCPVPVRGPCRRPAGPGDGAARIAAARAKGAANKRQGPPPPAR